MLVKVSKEFRWEMGHRLSYHQEGCQTLHGHSYRMTIELVGERDSGGMVLDYGIIKSIVDPLLERLDHSTMLHEEDTEVIAFFNEQNMKATIVPFHPTAENMAIWIGESLKPEFQIYNNLSALTVRVCETVSAAAEVTLSL